MTVGTQLPFDRLVHTVDEWATRTGTEGFAQVGPTKTPPTHLEWSESITPKQFDDHIARCTIVVAHAGMGTIISALRAQRKLLVMPRLAKLREHRNEHQLATVRALCEQRKITAAMDERELISWLDRIDDIPVPPPLQEHATPSLINTVQRFVNTGSLQAP